MWAYTGNLNIDFQVIAKSCLNKEAGIVQVKYLIK